MFLDLRTMEIDNADLNENIFVFPNEKKKYNQMSWKFTTFRNTWIEQLTLELSHNMHCF